MLRLQMFKYKIIYESGKSNIADPLSRLLRAGNISKREKSKCEDELYIAWIAKESVPKAMSIEEIEIESREDPWLSEVRQAIAIGNWESLSSTQIKVIKDELCICNSVILRGTRIVMPEKLKKRVLSIAHIISG